MEIAGWGLKNRRCVAEVGARGRVVATRETNALASMQKGAGALMTGQALVWDGSEWWMATLPKFDTARDHKTPHHVRWQRTPPHMAVDFATRIASRVDIPGDRGGWTQENIVQLLVALDPRCAPPPTPLPALAVCKGCGSTQAIVRPDGGLHGFVHTETCGGFRGNKIPPGCTVGEFYK